MSILENAARAIIDPPKLLVVALNPGHPRGRDKARVFRSALAYDRSNCSDLVEGHQAGCPRPAHTLS
ncbi:MAG TPA: hypothetical protein VFG47_05800 [Geminicoccaceae bacterium]|nr:hypothetical protein [Geminicoccaceae bacterium]